MNLFQWGYNKEELNGYLLSLSNFKCIRTVWTDKLDWSTGLIKCLSNLQHLYEAYALQWYTDMHMRMQMTIFLN